MVPVATLAEQEERDPRGLRDPGGWGEIMVTQDSQESMALACPETVVRVVPEDWTASPVTEAATDSLPSPVRRV
jgi:hypothetical protein